MSMINQPPHTRYTLAADTLYLCGSAAVFLLLFAAARALLLWRNIDLLGAIPWRDVAISFAVGLRFDLIVTCYALTPLVLAMLLPSGLARRSWCNVWLGLMALLCSFLAVLELDFYREFHARLNSLVFQYIKEDPKTVVSMLWFGFPVLRYLALCGALTAVAVWLISRIDRATRSPQGRPPTAYGMRLLVALLLIVVTAAAARGTFRSGPPLRWADAYRTKHLFTNHLALNGTFTLLKAAQQELNSKQDNPWLKRMPAERAQELVRSHWLTDADRLLEPQQLPLLRRTSGRVDGMPSPYKNVVLIIDESFSAQRTGVFGNPQKITPHFDGLAQEGLLFDHFFSQGTHTHQGMFATMACFPNLPFYEYLMKQPEGANNFSGLTKVLAERDYKSLYVYNGDFAWDNQSGFFRAQHMQRFIGRHDFINPRFSDRTWGVSDEDMFDRGFQEIEQLQSAGAPYFVVLQTLSNHAPYALPPQLPVEPVLVDGVRDEHLTAMRYNDYALGVFFDRIKQRGGFDDTLFVFLGDHGFGGGEQITDIDLWRFHIPLLIWGKDVQQHYGKTRSVVGSQVDVVPTIMGLLGGDYEHHCWGRDLLALPADAPGLAVIKPSGTDHTTAIIEGDAILVQPPNATAHLYRYTTLPHLRAEPITEPTRERDMQELMQAYLQTATRALLDNRVGHGDHVEQAKTQ
ncbi:MAG TPA: LTA synthase family protein [Spongiibacteraceae bacterium]|nr:LTA synthase family protein [Spongiibacteraceae bacterium]